MANVKKASKDPLIAMTPPNMNRPPRKGQGASAGHPAAPKLPRNAQNHNITDSGSRMQKTHFGK